MREGGLWFFVFPELRKSFLFFFLAWQVGSRHCFSMPITRGWCVDEMGDKVKEGLFIHKCIVMCASSRDTNPQNQRKNSQEEEEKTVPMRQTQLDQVTQSIINRAIKN
jgi:hypothetical protein